MQGFHELGSPLPDAEAGGGYVGATTTERTAMAIAAEEDSRPICPCCGGTGMHGYRPRISPSPDDDSEGCTNCGERGRTWFDDAPPRSCTGYRVLWKRVNR